MIEIMMKSNQRWKEVESDTSIQTGLLYKRFSAEVKPDAFIALKAPERLRCIAFRLSTTFTVDMLKWDTFKDIKIETITRPTISQKRSRDIDGNYCLYNFIYRSISTTILS